MTIPEQLISKLTIEELRGYYKELIDKLDSMITDYIDEENTMNYMKNCVQSRNWPHNLHIKS